MERRRMLIIAGCTAAAAMCGGGVWFAFIRFPPDTTPEGAYLRIAANMGRGDLRGCFAYLEDRAQHAAYSLRDYRQKALERIEESYPEPERSRLAEAYRPYASAPDGADVWVDLATKRGWGARLRRDLSGIAKVETSGERATIETARGTRYPMRRRENGMWGLTLFTAELATEAERAARDWDVVQRAAEDYNRAR
jgi:hypothetical protein